MQITKATSEGVDIITIQGQLDGTTSPQLEAEMHGPIQGKASRVVLDLGQVVLVSSAALRVLLAAAKRMKKHGGRILLCGLQPQVRQVFDISDLTAFFGMYPDTASALAATGNETAAPEPPKPAPVPASAAPMPPPVVEVKPPALVPAPVQSGVPSAPASETEIPSIPKPVASVQPPPPPVPIPPPAKVNPPLGETFVPSAARQPEPPNANPAPPVPPPVPAAAPAQPPASNAPAASLRRPAPAVVAKAREAASNLPPVPVAAAVTPKPPGAVPPPPPPPITKPIPAAARPAPAKNALPIVPILAGAVVLLGVIGIGAYFLTSKKPAPRTVVAATPSPTPMAEATPEATPTAEPVSTPSPTPIAVASPRPTASVFVPTPKPSVALATPAPQATEPPTATTDNVSTAAGAFDFNRSSPENQAINQAVLKRIDAMPLSDKDKAKLYQALDHAKGLGKLVTVNFASSRTELTPSDISSLNSVLHQPKVKRFVDDPTVVFIVLGFADTRGSGKVNKEVSERRAKKVVDALRGPCAVANVIHAIGMGGQEIAGESLEKNRVVEVWAVLP